MKTTAPFIAWKCLNTDDISFNVDHRTNQCILIIQPNFSRESDEMKYFIGLRCWAVALRSNKHSWKNCGCWRTWHWKMSPSYKSQTLQVLNQMYSWINQSCINKNLYLFLTENLNLFQRYARQTTFLTGARPRKPWTNTALHVKDRSHRVDTGVKLNSPDHI
jgi:hypothetical protein